MTLRSANENSGPEVPHRRRRRSRPRSHGEISPSPPSILATRELLGSPKRARVGVWFIHHRPFVQEASHLATDAKSSRRGLPRCITGRLGSGKLRSSPSDQVAIDTLRWQCVHRKSGSKYSASTRGKREGLRSVVPSIQAANRHKSSRGPRTRPRRVETRSDRLRVGANGEAETSLVRRLSAYASLGGYSRLRKAGKHYLRRRQLVFVAGR